MWPDKLGWRASDITWLLNRASGQGIKREGGGQGEGERTGQGPAWKMMHMVPGGDASYCTEAGRQGLHWPRLPWRVAGRGSSGERLCCQAQLLSSVSFTFGLDHITNNLFQTELATVKKAVMLEKGFCLFVVVSKTPNCIWNFQFQSVLHQN